MQQMKQALHAGGFLHEPVEIAQNKHARTGIRRPTEQGQTFDSPMFPFVGNEHHEVDALKLLKQNRDYVKGNTLGVILRVAKELNITITPYMRQNPDSIRAEVDRVLRA